MFDHCKSEMELERNSVVTYNRDNTNTNDYTRIYGSCAFEVQQRYKYVILLDRHCPVSNNEFLAISFSLVRFSHGFINCLASESFVVSLS